MAKYAISLGRLKNVIVFDKDDGPLISVKRLDGGSNEYAGKSIVADGTGQYEPTTTAGTGDVEGPGSSTDNALARFHLTTGKIIQNSVGILDDTGNLTGILINANVINAGTVATARLGSGTASADSYLRGDQTWAGAKQYHGFVDRTNSTLGMSGSDFQVTTGSSYVVYVNGTKYTKNATEQVAITTDNTLHYVYFDSSAVLTVSTLAWDITGDNVPVALVYKTGAAYAVFDERHGYRRDRDWHEWAHDTIGTRYESGFTGTFTDTTLSVTQGVIHDEDIDIDSGGTKTTCRLWYRNSGAGSMTFESAITTPYKITAGAIKYDNAGTIASVSANYYVASYVYATPDISYPIAVVVGQNQYINTPAGLTACRSEALPTIPGSPNKEWKLLYQVIFQNSGGSPVYIEANDKRLISTGPAGVVTSGDHQVLTNRSASNAHPTGSVYFSATDKLLGRSTSGAGDGEEISCSAAGRWLLTGYSGALTISGGEITPTGHIHTVATEGGAASDDLDTIVTTGVPAGARLILAADDGGNTVVVKNGTGNIYCGADFSLDSELDTIELVLTGAGWLRLSQADNG